MFNWLKENHFFHTWCQVFKKTDASFLGEDVNYSVLTEYRICEVCKRAQKYYYDSQGGSWSFLRNQEANILFNKCTKTKDGYLLVLPKKKAPGNE